MTDEQLKAIEVRARAAVEAAHKSSMMAENEYASTLEHASEFEREREELNAVVTALIAEVKRSRDIVDRTRGALADIAKMSSREMREVARRKAQRVYDETGR